MRKVAVKKLTASDLTLFQWHFKNANAGNQKAINLNRDPFVDELFPSLPEMAKKSGGKVAVDLSLFGPGLKGEYNLQRKIVKFGMYKNWRLDGEFIFNPEGDPERFNVLKPGDLVVLEFVGEGVPNTVKAIFLAQEVAADQAVHGTLNNVLGNTTMATITGAELAVAVDGAKVSDGHPIRQLLLESAVEDAALGGIEGPKKLRASGRKVSRAELLQAKAAADECGQRGEEFVNGYLAALQAQKQISEYEWIADDNAIAPYDFRATFSDKPKPTSIEVKSTTGEFQRKIHVSMNELLAMTSEDDYQLFRVYGVSDDDTAKLRIATDVGAVAKSVLALFEQLPKGVTVDSVSVNPDLFKFSKEITIKLAASENDADGTELVQATLL